MTTTAQRRRVLFLQYTNPAGYPPTQHAAEILAESGWDVHVIGVALASTAALEFSDNRSIRLTLVPPAPSGWRQKVHLLAFVARTLRCCIGHGPLWLYASDLLTAPAGLLASFMPNVRVIYHEHDMPAVSRPSLAMRLMMAARRRLLRRAALVVAPNQGRLDAMQREAPGMAPAVCVWNCPRRSEAAAQPHRASTDRGLWLVYHGSIVPARVPRAVIDALALLPSSVHLRIAGYETAGHPGYVGELQARAEQLGLAHRLEVRLLVPSREALLDLVYQSHVGLALMPLQGGDVNEQNMTGASNKAFEYLGGGVPLLVSRRPDWSGMFERPGLARACDPAVPASIAEAVSWFLSHEDDREAMGERGRQIVLTRWNYEQQFAPVLALMSRDA